MPAFSDTIQLVSSFPRTFAAAGGNGDSCLPVLSADGRFVLFASSANNLILNSNGVPIPSLVPACLDVYLRDRMNQTTALISVSTNGLAGGNGNSLPVGLSTNSQYALFESGANNLVAGDTNNAPDIFLRDLAGGATWLVSADTNGLPGNGASRSPAMTPDGRFVAFVSEASNLVANDTNKIADVFVCDLQTLTTTLISVGAVSTNPAAVVPACSSESPEITPDGRFVAFSSTATNLVPGVTNSSDIYVHDRLAGTNLWVSSAMRAQLQAVSGKTNGICYNLALSADGKFVAYQANVSPLGYRTNSGIILRYGLESGMTDIIHTNAATSIPTATETRNLDLNPTGGLIALVANSNDLQATTTCVQVWNAASGLTTLVSGNQTNAVTTGSISTHPLMTSDGRHVLFLSSAVGLVTNSTPGPWHLYVRDLLTDTTALVDADTNGSGSLATAATVPSLSADGRSVAFECGDGSLVPNDNNRSLDVFVRDLVAGTNELISAHHPSLASVSPAAPSYLPMFAASADGRFITFASEVDDPALGDSNSFRDLLVRDLVSNSVVLVSADPSGVAGNGASTEPAISADGRFVAFTSSATNLVSGDTNRTTDVFVRDLSTGITALASVKSNGVGSADGSSYSPSLSADGRWLLFRNQVQDLASGNMIENLLLRDLQSATTAALPTISASRGVMTPDGRFVVYVGSLTAVLAYNLCVWDSLLGKPVSTNNASNLVGAPAISPDGRLIAFSAQGVRIADRVAQTEWLASSNSAAALRFSGDGNWLTYTRYVAGSNQVFLYDIQNRTETLVSHAIGATVGGGGHSDLPDIGPDGRFVVYRTLATNLVNTVNVTTRQIILYDRLTGQNSLVSASRFTGLPGDDHSLRASFSPDGQTLLLQSWASDIAANDFNRSGDVLARAIFTAVILPPAATGQGPLLYWPFVPGNNYDVQFKDGLGESVWQTLPGSITNNGFKAWSQDVWPTSSQRFYRIRSF